MLRARRPARLLRAAALPPRLADLGDPRRQERAARGRALLRRGLQAGRAAQVPRRRRRSRRRLRRLADQLRVVDELHDAGVRERRRVRAAGDLRRGRRPAPDHRHRVGPRGRRAPLGAGRRRPRRRASSTSARRPRRSPTTRRRVVKNLFETYKEVSRKNLLESYHDALEYKDEALQLFNLGHLSLRAPRASPRTSSGRSARRCCGIVREHARGARGARGARAARCPTPTSATSRCSSRCPTRGRSISCSRSCPIHRLERGADAARDAGRHHLRLRRQDRSLHRSARRQARARAAPGQRRGLLPRHLPGRRLPGDPGRPPQPVRRHEHRARLAGRRAAATTSSTSSPATPSPTCSSYVSYSREELVAKRAPVRRAGACAPTA